ncbi:hypothetical protein BDF19DRAFT_451100 [Syncephalis fuscata]|nr:hypothetical protein BDF19DRAFT_451100 [Syncephalis fuscata]
MASIILLTDSLALHYITDRNFAFAFAYHGFCYSMLYYLLLINSNFSLFVFAFQSLFWFQHACAYL